MAKFMGVVIAFAVFVIWIRLVGNPHVVETVIGLCIATVAGIWTYRKVRAFSARQK